MLILSQKTVLLVSYLFSSLLFPLIYTVMAVGVEQVILLLVFY
ncbi:hypothetical protein Golob_028012 [Gossypium lobatum]|uniref:Uncharacterized protein n=1 Tax=Gossypium lobatum TaxID=34289 RepID=A0A7J8NDL4_9ROSI|nr:hypothetical protein [Gossypium lobatum]